jgi:hypothetical protein
LHIANIQVQALGIFCIFIVFSDKLYGSVRQAT